MEIHHSVWPRLWLGVSRRSLQQIPAAWNRNHSSLPARYGGCLLRWRALSRIFPGYPADPTCIETGLQTDGSPATKQQILCSYSEPALLGHISPCGRSVPWGIIRFQSKRLLLMLHRVTSTSRSRPSLSQGSTQMLASKMVYCALVGWSSTLKRPLGAVLVWCHRPLWILGIPGNNKYIQVKPLPVWLSRFSTQPFSSTRTFSGSSTMKQQSPPWSGLVAANLTSTSSASTPIWFSSDLRRVSGMNGLTLGAVLAMDFLDWGSTTLGLRLKPGQSRNMTFR